jgi:D-alanyl-D-alanine carboxypeptidase (penicillin-binding protein 5/6)
VSASPFMPPSGRRGSQRTARWRHRGALAGATLLPAVAVLATLLVLLHPWHSASAAPHGRRGEAAARAAGAARGAPPSPLPRSPTGLPLARPPLGLDLADPASDPIHVAFREPPRAGLLFDLDTGRVLWQRHPRARLPIASLTKLMTALLVVRSAPPREHVLITRRAEDTNGSKVGVLPLGRHVPLETLLYGLLLPSGNDAAVALAEAVAGTVPRFVGKMNASAAALGLGCTRFSSPSGYFNANNYSCAVDLAELAHVDLAQPRIARVTRTYEAVLPFPIKGGKLYLDNNNPLLVYGYPGATGLKTGWTIPAGRCLVATAERHGVRLGVVLLHSPAPGVQARALLDAAFARVYHLRRVPEPYIPPDA